MASKKSKSNRPFGAILAVVAVVGVATLGWVVSRPAKVVTLDPALPPMAAVGIVKGNPDALVEIVEFADFECPGCAYYATVTGPDVMKRLVETGDVRFRFMDYPLTEIHPNSVAAHNAAHCADEQGKFWEMHDLIFRDQDRWHTQVTRTPKKVLERLAGEAGADVAKWSECFDSGRKLPLIAANRKEGERLRVSSTPTFVIGGQLVQPRNYDEIRQFVSLEMARIANAQAAAAVKMPAPAKKTP